MRTEQQMANIVTQAMKNLHTEHAKKWGFPTHIITGATLGLAVTQMAESGYTEDQIIEIVRELLRGNA